MNQASSSCDSASSPRTPRIVEASIAELAAALDAGQVTSVELALLHLNRIARYDRQGTRLTLAGLQAYCRRCGCPLWPVG